jgi:serine/threonine protein kinase
VDYSIIGDPMSQLPINAEFGQYHIVRHIGGGGMAQIYLAKSRGLAGFEKHLALKVINPEFADEERFIQMLIDEAKITVGLNHVNICQVFDLGQVGGIYYIAMEFVDGIDVLELVNGLHALGERVPVEAVALIGRQICSGLHYAHTKKDRSGQPLNIVHRDISPQNILVSRAGEVKVVDFGIAKAAGMSTRTHAGVIKGKVHYMAPEQAMGQKADSRTDIFSSGIVLWEMLTSQMVYSGDNVRELVEKVRRAAIPPPSSVRPEIPPALDFIVMKALACRTEDRFATAHEFQIELTKFLSASAPDYSGSHLSVLVERVLAHKRGDADKLVEVHISKAELLADVHSVISEAIDESTSPRDRARLVVTTEQGETIYPLEEELIIGRAGTLAIADARVSRRHARVYRHGGEYIVEDLGSSNGTFVNDDKIAGPHTLRSGDSIRIGACHMRYIAEARPAPPSAAPVLRPPPVPKLVVACGERKLEKVLTDAEELHYTLQVGPVRLRGTAGRVVRKDDGYYVEPLVGREQLTFNGATPNGPVRLSPGDMFQLGPFLFEFRE